MVDTRITCYLKDAGDGDPIAQLKLGKGYRYYGSHDKATKWLKKSASQDNTEAMILLGKMSPVSEERYKWFKKGSDLGDNIAMYYLGGYYFDRQNKKHHSNRAFKWYKLSYELGNKDSISKLGFMYVCGVGTKRDINKAFDVLKKGVRHNYDCRSYMYKILNNDTVGQLTHENRIEICDVINEYTTYVQLNRVLGLPSLQKEDDFKEMNRILDNKYTFPTTVELYLKMRDEYTKKFIFTTMDTLFINKKHIPKDLLYLVIEYVV